MVMGNVNYNGANNVPVGDSSAVSFSNLENNHFASDFRQLFVNYINAQIERVKELWSGLDYYNNLDNRFIRQLFEANALLNKNTALREGAINA